MARRVRAEYRKYSKPDFSTNVGLRKRLPCTAVRFNTKRNLQNIHRDERDTLRKTWILRKCPLFSSRDRLASRIATPWLWARNELNVVRANTEMQPRFVSEILENAYARTRCNRNSTGRYLEIRHHTARPQFRTGNAIPRIEKTCMESNSPFTETDSNWRKPHL